MSISLLINGQTDPGPRTTRIASPFAVVLALALVVPMFVSAIAFRTYDIAVPSLPLEILRQLNAPFVVAQSMVIAFAFARGFRLGRALAELPRSARAALTIFLLTFWIGGTFQSQAAPFATLFNLTYLVHIAFLAAIAFMARGWGDADTVLLGRLVALALAGFAVITAIAFLAPPPGRPLDTIAWQFSIPGFISVRLFGAMAGAWAVFMLSLAIARGDATPYRGWVHWLCALAVGMAVWSGTRAAIVGIGAAGLIALALWWRQISFGRVVRASAAALAGATVGLLLVPYGQVDFMLYAPGDYVSGADKVAGGRVTLWLESLEAYRDIVLFGAGPGATGWILPDGIHPHIQPHNIVLSFLLNWGAIATICALFLLGKSVVTAHLRIRGAPDLAPFLLMADCILVMGFFDGMFHFAQHLMLWAAMMGVVLSVSRRVGDDAIGTPESR